MFTKQVIAKVSVLARGLNVEPAALLAVAEVESAGAATWRTKDGPKPAIRFEGHYFYRRLKGAKLKQAIAQGLASPKAGAVKNPNGFDARYALLERARKIDRAAADESTSWGLGQVMGAHWRKLSYSSVQALVDDAMSGVDGQIEIMARYIKAFGLVDELQSRGWKSFAKQYNGPAYRTNRYDEKMAKAYATYRKIDTSSAEVVASEGGDETVKGIQRDLKKLGYFNGPVNGKYGPMTKNAVRKFQQENGLTVDGKYGKMTDEAVDRMIIEKRNDNADLAVKSGTSVTGVGAVTDIVQTQVDQLSFVSQYSTVIEYLVVGLVLSGVALTAYGLYSKFKRKD